MAHAQDRARYLTRRRTAVRRRSKLVGMILIRMTNDPTRGAAVSTLFLLALACVYTKSLSGVSRRDDDDEWGKASARETFCSLSHEEDHDGSSFYCLPR